MRVQKKYICFLRIRIRIPCSTMNTALLKEAIVTRRLVPIIVPGYRYQNDIRLFSAVLVAELKQNNDKQSFNQFKNIQRRPDSLKKLVSKTFRSFMNIMDHLSNDFTAVRKWSDEHKKTVIIRRLNPEDWTYDVDVVTDKYVDSLELLDTTEPIISLCWIWVDF